MREHQLFDLDGTLTASAEGITRCVAYALEKLEKPPLSEDVLLKFIGPPLAGSFMQHCGMSEEQAAEANLVYRERYNTIGLYENEVYAGIPEMLAALKEAGKHLYVATAKPEFLAKQVLDHFDLTRFFEGIYGMPMTPGAHDKAEVLHRLLAEEQVAADTAVMVGDRLHDVHAATACGLPCVGVLYGYGSREELEEAGAAYIAEDVPALQKLLLGEETEGGMRDG